MPIARLTLACALLSVAWTSLGADVSEKARYEPLRAELRAFHPDECHEKCKDPAFDASAAALRADVEAYVREHPDFDALDLRRAFYLSARRNFRPFLFRESPFYFEAGVNGGWCEPVNPSRQIVNGIAARFYQTKGLIPQEALKMNGRRCGARLSLCCGPFSDNEHHVTPFRKIFAVGFKGVRDEVASALANCPEDDALGKKELETMLVGLDTVRAIQLAFRDEAKRRLEGTVSDSERRRLERIVESAARCPWEPPRTFYEGLNTLWFVREVIGYLDATCDFSLGRPDAWLAGFYAADLAAGRLTREEARDLMARWLVHSDCHLDTDATIDSYADQEAEMPVTLGGVDAEGRYVWNEITRTMIELHCALDLVFPKLHVRYDDGSPRDYLRLLGETLLKDHAVFAMFNDARHVPMFVARGLPLAAARDYVCTGCWDGNVDAYTDVDCANYVSVVRLLEATIHRDPAFEREFGLVIDPIDGARSFEEVRDTVYRNFMRYMKTLMADYSRFGRMNREIFPHPVYTACLVDGPARRRDVTDVGATFTPREITLAFLANVVDSLNAIRRLCFDDKVCTLDELLAAVRSNWAGEKGERLRRQAMASPYWGDNTEKSNALMRWWISSVADDIEGFRNDRGGPYELACWIYREFVYWGEQTKATPDGRRDGDRLAQGFSPSDFRCEADMTTVINAIATAPHDRLYASNANLSFDKTQMTAAAFEAVFRVYAKYGIHLLQPNCLSVEDLLDAQRHPERHRNLIVKVCGFSARFVSLSKRWQDEVIGRHRLRQAR